MTRHRTPVKLRINITPVVIDKEHPDFVTKWDRAIKQCEVTLIQTLVDHFNGVMKKTNVAIQTLTKEAYQGLKKIHPSGARKPSETPSRRQKRLRPKGLRRENEKELKRQRQPERQRQPKGAKKIN